MNKRILIISYAFDEPNLVGSFRCTYWAKQLAIMGEKVMVITASSRPHIDEKNLEILEILDKKKSRFPFIADQGYGWMKSISSILFQEFRPEAFSTIIISGGPFLQMLWSRKLKKRFNTKLILDFRDPFALNPRFSDSFLKKLAKSFLERQMCRFADEVITVNKFTGDLLACPKEKIHIIENGFNEEVINSVSTGDTIKGRIVHAGKVGIDRDPLPFINAVQAIGSVSFEHFGNKIENAPKSEQIILHDFVPYEEVLEAISKAEIGLVLTGGDPFVSTTKIFDYIGLNKKVIIVTNGKLHSGSLGEISKRNPNIFWSENNQKSITEVLQLALEKVYIDIFNYEFSRKHEFEKLKSIIL